MFKEFNEIRKGFNELNKKEKMQFAILTILYITAATAGSVLLINLVCRPGIAEHIGIIVKSAVVLAVSYPLFSILYKKW